MTHLPQQQSQSQSQSITKIPASNSSSSYRSCHSKRINKMILIVITILIMLPQYSISFKFTTIESIYAKQTFLRMTKQLEKQADRINKTLAMNQNISQNLANSSNRTQILKKYLQPERQNQQQNDNNNHDHDSYSVELMSFIYPYYIYRVRNIDYDILKQLVQQMNPSLKNNSSQNRQNQTYKQLRYSYNKLSSPFARQYQQQNSQQIPLSLALPTCSSGLKTATKLSNISVQQQQSSIAQQFLLFVKIKQCVTENACKLLALLPSNVVLIPHDDTNNNNNSMANFYPVHGSDYFIMETKLVQNNLFKSNSSNNTNTNTNNTSTNTNASTNSNTNLREQQKQPSSSLGVQSNNNKIKAINAQINANIISQSNNNNQASQQQQKQRQSWRQWRQKQSTGNINNINSNINSNNINGNINRTRITLFNININNYLYFRMAQHNNFVDYQKLLTNSVVYWGLKQNQHWDYAYNGSSVRFVRFGNQEILDPMLYQYFNSNIYVNNNNKGNSNSNTNSKGNTHTLQNKDNVPISHYFAKMSQVMNKTLSPPQSKSQNTNNKTQTNTQGQTSQTSQTSQKQVQTQKPTQKQNNNIININNIKTMRAYLNSIQVQQYSINRFQQRRKYRLKYLSMEAHHHQNSSNNISNNMYVGGTNRKSMVGTTMDNNFYIYINTYNYHTQLMPYNINNNNKNNNNNGNNNNNVNVSIDMDDYHQMIRLFSIKLYSFQLVQQISNKIYNSSTMMGKYIDKLRHKQYGDIIVYQLDQYISHNNSNNTMNNTMNNNNNTQHNNSSNRVQSYLIYKKLQQQQILQLGEHNPFCKYKLSHTSQLNSNHYSYKYKIHKISQQFIAYCVSISTQYAQYCQILHSSCVLVYNFTIIINNHNNNNNNNNINNSSIMYEYEYEWKYYQDIFNQKQSIIQLWAINTKACTQQIQISFCIDNDMLYSYPLLNKHHQKQVQTQKQQSNNTDIVSIDDIIQVQIYANNIVVNPQFMITKNKTKIRQKQNQPSMAMTNSSLSQQQQQQQYNITVNIDSHRHSTMRQLQQQSFFNYSAYQSHDSYRYHMGNKLLQNKLRNMQQYKNKWTQSIQTQQSNCHFVYAQQDSNNVENNGSNQNRKKQPIGIRFSKQTKQNNNNSSNSNNAQNNWKVCRISIDSTHQNLSIQPDQQSLPAPTTVLPFVLTHPYKIFQCSLSNSSKISKCEYNEWQANKRVLLPQNSKSILFIFNQGQQYSLKISDLNSIQMDKIAQSFFIMFVTLSSMTCVFTCIIVCRPICIIAWIYLRWFNSGNQPNFNFKYPLNCFQLKLKMKRMIAQKLVKIHTHRRKQSQDHIKLQQQEDQGDDCVFCLQRKQPGLQIVQIYCKHTYHRECFQQWVRQQSGELSCPICKRKISVEGLQRYEASFSQERIMDNGEIQLQ